MRGPMADPEHEGAAPTRTPSEIAYMPRQAKRRSVPAMMRVLARLDREENFGRLRALSTLRPSEQG